ncbi:MAG TPA: FUSC family protein, partial [Bacillales bacterium]|nr:FUSC family protein [Bacillales bacterium]
TDEKEDADKIGLDPTAEKAIQALIAGGLAIVIGYLLSPAHQYWALISAFVVFFGTETIGRTIIKASQRFLGTLFGAIAGFGLVHIVAGRPLLEVALLFFCIFMGFYLIQISYALMIFWITMLLSIMYSILLGGISEQLLEARVLDTFIGAGLGALATAFLFPHKSKDKVRDSMTEFLTLLKENVSAHLKKFTGNESTEGHAHQAFELDEKLQQIKDDAEPFTKRPMNLGRSEIEHQLTVFTALNYYAKHLVSSTDRKESLNLDASIRSLLEHVENSVHENIETLCGMLAEKRSGPAVVWDLKAERERLERSPDDEDDGKADQSRQLIYDLYYIWRINKAVLSMSKDFGAEVKRKDNARDKIKPNAN